MEEAIEETQVSPLAAIAASNAKARAEDDWLGSKKLRLLRRRPGVR